MKTFLGIVVAIFATLHFVSPQSIGDLCQECTMVNGAGYRDVPSDCTKYLHCYEDAFDNIRGEIRQCAFSTYWDNDVLTCRAAEDLTCPTDYCIGKANGYTIDGEGNCRGFWECKNGKAEAKCCPEGQYWNATDCVDNDDFKECNASCFNEQAKKETCADKRPFPGNPAFFQQQVHEIFWVTMPCATGTTYVQESCRCEAIVATVPAQKITCKPEIYLPFTDNHLDASGNNFYVRNENVVVSDGIAKFNGINSRLIVPRFTNLEHSETVVIKVKYVSNHQTSPELHAVVSNSDCGNLPSILIAEDSDYIRYAVGTSMVNLASVFVPQNQTTSFKDVVFNFDEGVLTGSEGVVSNTEQAPGYLRNVQCAFHIGHADNLFPFKGEIDEISVYLCNPDD